MKGIEAEANIQSNTIANQNGHGQVTPNSIASTKPSIKEKSVTTPAVAAAQKNDFEPIILAFSCNWCSYTSADLAGVNRFHYPACVRVIRFMCSGRIEPDFIMRAFECGADGVIVSGCKLGECHYISGNEKAQKRLEMTGKLLDLLGIQAERLGSVWISAAEGAKFASYMNEFVEKIKTLGPSPTKSLFEK